MIASSSLRCSGENALAAGLGEAAGGDAPWPIASVAPSMRTIGARTRAAALREASEAGVLAGICIPSVVLALARAGVLVASGQGQAGIL